jgi:hypothetical protein
VSSPFLWKYPHAYLYLGTRPRPMQLTAGDEIVAIENLEVLKANGFEVDVDEDQPPGRGERVKLVAMPISKDTVFDFQGSSFQSTVFPIFPLSSTAASHLHVFSSEFCSWRSNRPGTTSPPSRRRRKTGRSDGKM